MQGEGALPIFGEKTEKFYRIPINLHKEGDLVLETLYLLYQGNYIVYRQKNSKWTADDTRRLSEFGAVELFIKCGSEKEHFKFIEGNLDRILHEPNRTTDEKVSVLYQCATGIAESVFENPTSTETFVRSKKVVNQTIGLMAKDSDAFLQMIKLSSHDYYTYTHCVNVMTFTIGLLTALGEKDQRVIEDAAIGAFLHDIGKSKVPLTILNKPGPLSDDEWKIMKQHPNFGLEVLSDKPVPSQSKNAIVQHHEKINGIGYPFGLKGDKIQIVSQVVSVCDAYDAMTTNRCYQKAKKPFEAFQLITQEMRGHFDPKIVETFIKLLNLQKLRS